MFEFPNHGGNFNGYPLERATRRMLRVTADYLAGDSCTLKKVIFCLYDQPAYDKFAEALAEVTGKTPQ